MSYLENFKEILSHNKKNIRKRIFIGMYSVHWNDEFKIYLAESIKKGSKYFHSNHGSGVEGKYDTLHDHFDDISENTIVQTKRTTSKNQIFLGSTLFKFRKKNSNSQKLLINFHEPERYFLRFPISTTHLDGHIKSFQNLNLACKKLRRDVFKNIKYRSKHNVGFNSEFRFLKLFGKSKIENVSSIKYADSVLNSKLVLCHVPQTSYTECLFYNVPTVLIVDDLEDKKIETSFFDTREKKKILKKFLQTNMAFTSHDLAAKFINKNWEKIHIWWNNKNVQNARKAYLDNFFATDQNFEKNWTKFINQNLKKI
jgi:putative transferase (TIGR04331 family)